MKTIMFSAVFGASVRPERLKFLQEIQNAFPEPVRIVALNNGAPIEADIPVVDLRDSARPRLSNSMDDLEKLLGEHCPAEKTILLDHVRGELGFGTRKFEHLLRGHTSRAAAFCQALEDYAPDCVYLWNQFNALHRTFEAILKRRGIPVRFFHDGVLPGSIALDMDGEMGESWIAKSPERLASIPVTEADMERARLFLSGLSEAENMRHPQEEHISVKEALRLRGLNRRPVLFFAGQNDWHAGVKPKSPARAFHSPVFSGSFEALVELDKVAGDLGLAVIFKPHPLSRDRFAFLRARDFPNSIILQNTSMDACLEVCDIAATIASQASYVAIQKDHPVVMLGRNQLSGKGLTYDVNDIEKLSETIQTALVDPLAASRSDDFCRHAAQLEKVYLFDYGTMQTEFYTRGIDAAARLIKMSADMATQDIIDAVVSGGH